ncbi:YeeE/YedE thiosulfate transporter family protein [Acidobacteriota bacterium]
MLKLLPFIVVGIACGILFAKYQLCFAQAVRNLLFYRRKEKFIFFVIIVVASAFFLNLFIGLGMREETVKPLTPITFVGGILFGIGMVIAGGCTAGTLYRVGEGNVSAFIATIGMVVGMGMFGFTVAASFTKKAKHFVGDTLLQRMHIHPLLFSIIVLVVGFLAILYMYSKKNGEKRRMKTTIVLSLVLLFNATLLYELFYFKHSDCKTITAFILKETIESGEEVVVLDIRPKKFYSKSHIEGAIALSDLPNGMKDMSKAKNKMVVVVCGEGILSELFCIKLNKSGFQYVYNLKGGMSEWK